MHFPQVWCLWYNPEIGRALRARAQYSQRENLHLSMVLVHHIGGLFRPSGVI